MRDTRNVLFQAEFHLFSEDLNMSIPPFAWAKTDTEPSDLEGFDQRVHDPQPAIYTVSPNAQMQGPIIPGVKNAPFIRFHAMQNVHRLAD
jgi:hypothetical protein